MNQCCIPGIGGSGLFKKYILISLLASGIFSCTFNDPELPATNADNRVKSPFAGTWISMDSDRETAFKLFIEQEQDSLQGYYCLVKYENEESECQTPNAAHKGIAFAAKLPQGQGFSTELYNLKHQILGHVQLSITDSVLFWQLLRGPDDHEFMIRQTTFRHEVSLE